MSKKGKHHYLPVFYLKRWAGSDSRVCQYSRPHSTVKARRVHPDATGYVHGLYSVPGLPSEHAQYVEKTYMLQTDDMASKALQVFLNPGGPAELDLDARGKFGWARFLYSLMVRTPENLERMRSEAPKYAEDSVEKVRESYHLLRGHGDPPTFDEFKTQFLANPRNTAPQIILPNLLNSHRVIAIIACFRHFTITIHKSRHTLLTSDRPIVMTNGLIRPDAHIVIPIAPQVIFVAAKSEETYALVRQMPADKLVAALNDKVAIQARQYVYGIDDKQLRFVENRLGKCVPATPLG